MSLFNLRALPLATLVAGLMGAPAAMAQQTWGLDLSTCGAHATSAVACGAATVSTGPLTLGTTYASAFAAATTGGTFGRTSLSQNGSGSGLGAGGGTSPEHAVDNTGSTELILLHFTTAVTLSNVTIGWAGGSPVDSDISIFALGSGFTPTGSGSGVTKETNLANNAMTSNGVSIKATGALDPSIGNSWALVGNYADADNPNSVNGGSDNAISVNGGAVTSSWWLISAFNSRYGGTCTENANQPAGASKGCSDANDFIKILSVAGTVGGTPGSGVPEPASLALVMVALAGGLSAYRRRPVQA